MSWTINYSHEPGGGRRREETGCKRTLTCALRCLTSSKMTLQAKCIPSDEGSGARASSATFEEEEDDEEEEEEEKLGPR